MQVTALGFGSAEVGYLKTEHERAAQVIRRVLDSGINLLDTAVSYPGSEDLIGQTVADRRKEYVLVSKCGSANATDAAPAWSAKLIAQSVDLSLKRLRTDHLDVMLLHSCDLPTLQKGEALGALVKARDQGKIRFCGYSGDNEAAAYAATLAEVAVIETSISICDQANIDMVLPAARRQNVGVLVKRAIANAAWRPQLPGMYSEYAKSYVDRFKAMQLDANQLGFSGDPQELWPQIALRFTLSQPGVHCAIIGTTNPENIDKNIALAGQGPLDEQVVKQLRDAFAAAAAGKNWPGQT